MVHKEWYRIEDFSKLVLETKTQRESLKKGDSVLVFEHSARNGRREVNFIATAIITDTAYCHSRQHDCEIIGCPGYIYILLNRG